MDKLDSSFNNYLYCLQQTAAKSSNAFNTALAPDSFWTKRLVFLGKGITFDIATRITAIAGIIITAPLKVLTAIPYIITHLPPIRFLPQAGMLRKRLARILELETKAVTRSLIACIAPFYLTGRANTTVQAIINYVKTHATANTIERMIFLLMLRDGVAKTSWDQGISIESLTKECQKNTGGYTSVYNNAILSSLFESDREAVALTEDGKLMQDKGKFYKTAYCLDVGNRNSPKDSWEYIASILTQLYKETSDHKRIGKLFIPLGWSDKGTGHEVLLIIETNKGSPRITLLNTHGNSLNKYKHYEDYLVKQLEGFFGIGSMPPILKFLSFFTSSFVAGGTIYKNTKTIYSTAYSCGPDIMHIIESLKDCPNIQERIKQGLPRLSSDESQQTRIHQAELVSALSRRYLTAAAA